MQTSPPREYPIRDYAIIGNCETAALINPDGGIDWLCLPAFDSPTFFGALLDRDIGGEFSIRPAHPYHIEREYIDNSAILRSRFATEKGILELIDFFVIAREPSARFYDFTSLYPTRKLVRMIKLLSGASVSVELALRARPNYGREKVAWRTISTNPSGYSIPPVQFYSNTPIELEGDNLTAEFLARPNCTYFAVLEYGRAHDSPSKKRINWWRLITEAYWREWNLFNYYRGSYERIIRQSAVTLKLLTYASTGAFVAAPTTSLPERIRGDQNWDYRYL